MLMSSSSNSDIVVKSDNSSAPCLVRAVRIEGRSGLRLHPAVVRVQRVYSTDVDNDQAFFAAGLLCRESTSKEESLCS